MSQGLSARCTIESFEPRRHFAAGLTAAYFPTTTFTGTAVSTNDASLTVSTPTPAGISSKSFSARWTGQLNATATGRHALYISSEGGVRVWINHKLVLNKPAAPGVVTHYKTVTVLTANVPATVQIEYRHDAGKRYIAAAWVSPGGDKRILAGSDVSTRDVALGDKIDHARVFAADQLGATYRSLKVADGAPIRSQPNKPEWYRQPFTDWTSGTFAGAMWELNKTFAGWDAPATKWTTPLANVKQVGDAFDREWAAYKPYYDATGDAAAKQVLLKSAALKMTAWNDTVKAFKTPELVSHSGNPKANFGVLMDQTNDMAHLLWAGQVTGDGTYQQRVVAHMLTVARNMVRPDGTVFQRGYFDSATGKFVVGENSQGYSDSSTWSRAQAWAVRSFTDVAIATGNTALLEVATKVTSYFMTRLPADSVPYWDFQSPNIPKTYRDTSAAAIAASAMFRLARYTNGTIDDAQFGFYAKKILDSLLSEKYLAEGTNLKGVLQHGAQHVPANKGVDAALMFGDYYLLQAMNDAT